MMADHPGDVRWLTYEEAGRILGIDAASVTRRARRLRWRRQAGNDGKARVAVPLDVLPDHPADRPRNTAKPKPSAADIKPEPNPDTSGAVLLGALLAATERAERAEGMLLEATRQAAHAAGEAAALRVEAERLRDEVDWLRQPWWRRLLYRD